MQLYSTLEKYQKIKSYRHSDDYHFYLENRHLFANIDAYRFLLMPTNEFDVIRANIVIEAIKNKKILDEAIIYAFKESSLKTNEVSRFLEEKMAKLPYIQDGSNKIFVPIFSRATNQLYAKNFGKLMRAPYSRLLKDFSNSAIDLFDVYNFSLYNSMFTRFVPLYQDDKILVVYHYDFMSLYIINNEGRLDAKLALFDKYIRRPDFGHIIERLKAVVDAYLLDDREALYNALIDNKFISARLIHKIKHREYRFKKRLSRKSAK